MNIELLGVSGIGKTSVLNICVEQLEEVSTLSSDVEISDEDVRFYLDYFEINDFLDGVINIVAASKVHPSQKLSVMQMIFSTAKNYVKSRLSRSSQDDRNIYVEDEFFFA